MSPRRRDQANQPADTPAAAGVAVVLALALIALGMVAGREFLLRRNVFHGRAWLRPLLEWLGRTQWHTWLLAPGFGGVLLGLVLLAIAAKPRNRRHIGTRGLPALWLRPTDVARASTAAALRVGGITHAHTIARRRSVDIHVSTERNTPDVTDAVLAEVTAALAELAVPPRIKVAVAPVVSTSPRRNGAAPEEVSAS